MNNRPQPRNAEDADAAEKRLQSLHNRFSQVSRGADGSRFGGGGLPVSFFELLIIAGLFGFLAVVALRIF